MPVPRAPAMREQRPLRRPVEVGRGGPPLGPRHEADGPQAARSHGHTGDAAHRARDDTGSGQPVRRPSPGGRVIVCWSPGSVGSGAARVGPGSGVGCHHSHTTSGVRRRPGSRPTPRRTTVPSRPDRRAGQPRSAHLRRPPPGLRQTRQRGHRRRHARAPPARVDPPADGARHPGDGAVPPPRVRRQRRPDILPCAASGSHPTGGQLTDETVSLTTAVAPNPRGGEQPQDARGIRGAPPAPAVRLRYAWSRTGGERYPHVLQQSPPRYGRAGAHHRG
jgi:hypothetical protein